MGDKLEDDLLASRSVVKGDGSLTVTIPSDAVKDFSLEPGDRVVFSGCAGDDRLEVRTTDNLLDDD